MKNQSLKCHEKNAAESFSDQADDSYRAEDGTTCRKA